MLSIEAIQGWLQYAQPLNPSLVVLFVISLLVLDLFVAVPMLTVIVLCGYLLVRLPALLVP